MAKIIASLITCLIVITAFADDHEHGPDGDKAMHDIETSLFLLAPSKKATIHVTFDATAENAVIIYSENRKNKIWEIKNYGSDKKKVESGSFSLPKNSSRTTMGYIISVVQETRSRVRPLATKYKTGVRK